MLRIRYSQVVGKLIRIFKQQNIDVEEVITVLRFDDVEKKTIFSTDAVFNTIKTATQLLRHVGQYCKGIYDYQLLEVLVQASRCEEAIRELNNFTEMLQDYVLSEIELMSEHGELLHPDDFMPGTYKFIIEYMGGRCTLGTKEMIQSIVEQSVRVRKGVLIFRGFDIGSFLLIYQISEVVKGYLLEYRFAEQDIMFLKENNITNLIVDDIGIMKLPKVANYIVIKSLNIF